MASKGFEEEEARGRKAAGSRAHPDKWFTVIAENPKFFLAFYTDGRYYGSYANRIGSLDEVVRDAADYRCGVEFLHQLGKTAVISAPADDMDPFSLEF